MATEKRLIDANALIEKLPIVAEDKRISLYGAVADFMVMISAMPTVAAVEVVRCCCCTKHDHDGGDGYCNRWDKWTKMSDFCSYGERRTDNEKKAD